MLARLVAAFIAVAPVAAAAADAGAQTGAWKRFGSWSVACDNARACTAAAGDSDRDSALALALTRSGERHAPPVLRFAFHHATDGPRRGVVTVSSAGRTVARLRIGTDLGRTQGGLALVSPQARAAILSALRGEAVLQVRFDRPPGAAQRTLYAIPLQGAAAALLWMDERQRRIGTATALARPGSRPASMVPPTPPLPARPRAVPLPQDGEPPTLSDVARERIDALRQEGCDPEIREAEGHEKPVIRRLTEGRLLVSVRCFPAGVATSETYFIVRDGASPQVDRARFPRPYEGQDGTPAERETDFVLSDVDDGRFAQGELASGDGTHGGSFCGERARWIWTGNGFEARAIATLLPCGAAWVVAPLYRTR